MHPGILHAASCSCLTSRAHYPLLVHAVLPAHCTINIFWHGRPAATHPAGLLLPCCYYADTHQTQQPTSPPPVFKTLAPVPLPACFCFCNHNTSHSLRKRHTPLCIHRPLGFHRLPFIRLAWPSHVFPPSALFHFISPAASGRAQPRALLAPPHRCWSENPVVLLHLLPDSVVLRDDCVVLRDLVCPPPPSLLMRVNS